MVHTSRLQNYTSWSLVAVAPTLPVRTGRLLLLQLSRDFLLLLLGSPPSLLGLFLGALLVVLVLVLLLGVVAGDGGELVEYLEEARLARPGGGEDADVDEFLLVRVLVAVHLVLHLRRPRHLLRGRVDGVRQE